MIQGNACELAQNTHVALGLRVSGAEVLAAVWRTCCEGCEKKNGIKYRLVKANEAR